MAKEKIKDKPKEKAKKSKKGEGEKSENPFLELVSTVAWAVGIALVLRTFLFQPFHIPSGSMLPGLMKGDYVITCLLYTSPSPRDATLSRMPSSA